MPAEYDTPPHGFRTFVIIWASQSVSVLGTALTYFAIVIWLTQTLYPLPQQKPELAFALTVESIAITVPMVFGAPFAGAWADRHARRRTMIAMNAASGVCSLALAVLLATRTLNLWLLLPIVFVSGLSGAYHSASFDTSYAMLVPAEKLPRANGMMQAIFSLSGILSPAIAATLISLPDLARQGLVPGAAGAALRPLRDGTALATAIDALTFFAAAVVLLAVRVPSPHRADRAADGTLRTSMWADVREGAVFIWHRRPLLWLLGTFTLANFAGTPAQLFQPLLLKYNLAPDWSAHHYTFAEALALLGLVSGLGGLLGGVLVSAWGGLKRRRVLGVLIPMAIEGAALVVFGLSSLLYVAAAMLFINTAMGPLLNAHSQAIWQARTPRELQGRVFAVRRVIAWCVIPLSTALAGWAAAFLNPGLVLAALGGVLCLFCMAQLFNPYLRRVDDHAYSRGARRARQGRPRRELTYGKRAPRVPRVCEKSALPVGPADFSQTLQGRHALRRDVSSYAITS